MLSRPPQSAHACRRFIALSLALVLLGMVQAFAQRRSPPVLVRRVIDGDTVDIAALGRVGLLGIDAPEIRGGLESSLPFAREAQERLSGLLANRWIRLEYENDAAGSRGSAYVFLEDGRFVNEWMVREGLARVSARRGLRRSAELLGAEAVAQASRRGIWGDRPANPSETYRMRIPKAPLL